jgi:type II secretory pathway component PulF
MAFYHHTSLKDGTEKVHGKIEADSQKEARELLRKQGLLPLKLEEEGVLVKQEISESTSKIKRKAKATKRIKIKKLSMRDQIDFTNILYTFARSGISLVESLFFIEMNSESKAIQNLAVELRKLVLSGGGLSDAIAKFPSTFNQVYVGLVRAGEESGELETTLKRLSYLLEKQDKLRSKVIAIMAYPIFITILAMLVTTVMLMFVFPKFKEMYSQMGITLPWITSAMMDFGEFLQNNWYTVPLMFMAIAGALYYLFTWHTTRRIIDEIALNIPLVEKFVRFTSLSNFITAMRVSFDAGITLVDSLLFANLTVTNIILNESLKKVAVDVQFGQSLTSSLKSSKVMPGIVMCMIATGEEAGSLGEMLEQAGMYIDEQIERVVDILSKMMEPILFVAIGGLVLALGLALYLPLFKAYSSM